VAGEPGKRGSSRRQARSANGWSRQTAGLGLYLLISLVAAIAVVAAAACKGEPAPTATATPASAQADCMPARPHEPGSFPGTLTSGGLERQYILRVPISYTGEDAMPLVLNLHGHGSNAVEQAVYSGLPAKGEEEGFIVVTPQGTGVEPHWNFTTVEAGAPNDVAFISDLLDTLETELCIDPSRVYAAGYSAGAAMSATLACFLSDRIAAIAPVAGLYFFPGCPSVRPVSVIAFNGTDDKLVPFEGGPVSNSALRVPPVEDSLQQWAEHDGCASGPQDQRVSDQVRLRRYDDCSEGATVELYAVEGGGHTWPGAAIDLPLLGATTHEISATDLIWAFFEAHPKP
jgi:polyhydroxybutyrate depolymerase